RRTRQRPRGAVRSRRAAQRLSVASPAGWCFEHATRDRSRLDGYGLYEMNPAQKLGMKAQAAMLLAFIDSLGLERVDLVGNDSGGGAAQILAAEHPERVRTLTLTDCEVHDYD